MLIKPKNNSHRDFDMVSRKLPHIAMSVLMTNSIVISLWIWHGVCIAQETKSSRQRSRRQGERQQSFFVADTTRCFDDKSGEDSLVRSHLLLNRPLRDDMARASRPPSSYLPKEKYCRGSISTILGVAGIFVCHDKSSSHYCYGEEDSDPPTSSLAKFPFQAPQQTCGDCVLQNCKSKQPPFQGCSKYDVLGQFDVETQGPYAWFLPQHFALPLFHQAYPNATFVLNIRSDPFGPRVFCTGIR